MNIKVKKLSHVSLSTNNLNKTIDFYKNILGFKVVHEFRNNLNELYGVFLQVGEGTFIEFFNSKESLKINEPFRHICFEIEDINSFSKELKKIGFENKIIRGKTDRILQLKILDPNGIEIEFHQYDELSLLKNTK